jgi:hypothetical protein
MEEEMTTSINEKVQSCFREFKDKVSQLPATISSTEEIKLKKILRTPGLNPGMYFSVWNRLSYDENKLLAFYRSGILEIIPCIAYPMPTGCLIVETTPPELIKEWLDANPTNSRIMRWERAAMLSNFYMEEFIAETSLFLSHATEDEMATYSKFIRVCGHLFPAVTRNTEKIIPEPLSVLTL